MNKRLVSSTRLPKTSPLQWVFLGLVVATLSNIAVAANQSNNQVAQASSPEPNTTISTIKSTTNNAGHEHIDHSKHQAQLKSAGKIAQTSKPSTLSIPNVTLLNELGEKVALMDDLIQDKIVVINTIYTTCTTVCPVMGIQYVQLQKKLLERFSQEHIDKQMLLLSISIDPLNDTPQRLAAFKEKFGGGPGWTLLTGSQSNIDNLLKATGLFAADPQEHTPITLVGSTHTNHWTRVSGLGPAKQIASLMDDLAINTPKPTTNSATTNALSSDKNTGQKPPAQQYFTDVTLINQHGKPRQLYSDLLKDKTVIIHSFFSTCKSGCPVSMRLMAGIQQRFKEQMGNQLHILSISLDPQTDTPLKLKAYAEELNVGPGWQLISGTQHNVDFALKKLGHYVSDIEAHKNTLIIGNETTGLWKKAFLLAKPDELDKLIATVIEDKTPVTVSTH
ncbi:MAG: protein SCO1/2 [Alteromonadaceae bacterium]|jgi:protein SCO1/2